MLIQRGQWINSLCAALAGVLGAAYACLGLSRAPLRLILRGVRLARLMQGCRIGLLFFHLMIKKERITHTNKRHAGPKATAAGAELAFTVSQSGRFPW